MKDSRKIKIFLRGHAIKASLNSNSRIGMMIHNLLPITCRINTWGDELYFTLKLNTRIASPTQVVNMGDIAYSETWKALCVFYGKTPYSKEDEIIPNGPVEVIGRIDEDPSIFKKILSGYFKEKRRRIAHRIPALRFFAETIALDKLDTAGRENENWPDRLLV